MNFEDPSGHFWQVLVASAVAYIASYIYEWAVGMHDFSGTEMATYEFEGKDHYHIYNPNSTGKGDIYLDINGNSVAKGSKASHILP